MRKLVASCIVGILALCCMISALNEGLLFPLSFQQQSMLPLEDIDEFIEMAQVAAETDLVVYFSHTDFFFEEEIDIELVCNDKDAIIYYTLDGATPSDDSNLYIGPIHIQANENTCATVRAIAIRNEKASTVQTQSYFVWPGVNERFLEDAVVFSLSAEQDDLYDYEYGILVPGKIYDEYMLENPDTEVWPEHRPANYSQTGYEWERPVYVEAFVDGERVLAQNAGLRVHGGSSRYNGQKSLRLIARKAYQQGTGQFHYDFYPNLHTETEYAASITAYDTITLHTGGNELLYGMVRTPLFSGISNDVGYMAISPVRPVVVFLNGAYYGFAWLNVRYNNNFLQDLYRAPTREFEIATGGHSDMEEVTEATAQEFEELLVLAQAEGFLEAENFERFTQLFDLEEYLFYYAFEFYLGNNDWPMNNIRFWRYTGEEPGEGALDGRWRPLAFDLDMCWYEVSKFSLEYLMDTGPLLAAVLEREDARKLFANYVCDVANLFSYKEVEKRLEEMMLENSAEFETSFRYGAQAVDDVEERWQTMLEWQAPILANAQVRFAKVAEQIQAVFGYTGLFTIYVEGPARLNLYNHTQGSYFVESTVTVTPDLDKHQAVSYWLVNGQRIDGESLLLSAEDAINNEIRVELVYSEQLPVIRFVSAYDDEEMCGFTLENTTSEKQSLQGIYLSDSLDNLKKFELNNIRIGANAQLEFVGKEARNTAALLKLVLNFNPRSGEVVYLSDAQGNILDYIAVA